MVAQKRELNAIVYDPKEEHPARGINWSIGPFRQVFVAYLTPLEYISQWKKQKGEVYEIY